MAKILEYISLNYIWILIGLIIIVLAIIGYYAEKSNFSQGKTKNNKSIEDEENPKLNLEKVTLSDLMNKEGKNKNNNEPENINAQEIFNENSLDDIPDNTNKLQGSIIQPQNIGNINEPINDKIEQQKPMLNENNLDSDSMNNIADELFSPIESVPMSKPKDIPITEKNNILKNDSLGVGMANTDNSISDLTEVKEETEDFNKRFDEVIPKKDIIDDDILEDMDDLSLENTQIFGADDIPDLDDVDLPEIRDTNISENDIWKF